jgi:hypothetical protein
MENPFFFILSSVVFALLFGFNPSRSHNSRTRCRRSSFQIDGGDRGTSL